MPNLEYVGCDSARNSQNGMVVVVVVVVVVVMDLAVSGNMLAAIRAVEELPVEQLDGDHSKYELLGEEMIELNNFKFQLKLL